VYTAIWFAGSLLGVAGLFLFQHAQFLGLATIVVYAGAIVVTFLFVLMLANPEGTAKYDRITWAKFAMPAMVLVAALLVTIIAIFSTTERVKVNPARPQVAQQGDHMAVLGSELFARHMVSVEVAGTILLVALVGAVAIAIQGKEQRSNSTPQTSALGDGSHD
jgi:NADH-quinone oxidoreductase subunit J